MPTAVIPQKISLLLVLSFLANGIQSNIHIWEPKNLRDWYKNNNFEYSITDFGAVPYGHSVYGTVFKANPFEACTELSPLNWASNDGTLIILTKRGGCNFSQKVLNAQNIGAGLVLISNDNTVQDVHQIFPIERTKERLDKIKIPSVLINKKDADKIQEILDGGSQKTSKVELAVQFQLRKSGDKSEIRFIISVDDYRSYDSLLTTLDNMGPFRDYIDLNVHYKVFKNAPFMANSEECIFIKKDHYCVNNSYGDQYRGTGLVHESQHQICFYYHQFDDYANYIREIRNNCFDDKNGLQVRADFEACSQKILKKFTKKADNQELNECLDIDTIEAKRTMDLNHDNVKYFLINYSPLVFINGYYYKGNFDNAEYFYEALCNSFETPPEKCKDLEIFKSVHQFNTASLFNFILAALGLCLLASIILIIIFYVFYKKKIRRKFDYELNEKISEALANYYQDGGDHAKTIEDDSDDSDSELNVDEKTKDATDTKDDTDNKNSEELNVELTEVETIEAKIENTQPNETKEKVKDLKELKDDLAETEDSIKSEDTENNGVSPKNIKKGRLGKLKKLGK